VKAHAQRAGLDPKLFAGHSLRSGFPTSAAARGASIFKMADQSRLVGVLKEIHRHGGDAAFHRAARDLVASVAATVAHVEGRQHMLDVLGHIDRATEA